MTVDPKGPVESENSQLKPGKNALARHNLGNVPAGFVTIAQAAETYNVSERTLRNWCNKGNIPCITRQNGKQTFYLLRASDVQERIIQTKSTNKPEKHTELIEPWLQSLANGTFNGRPFSHHTISFYDYHVTHYFRTHTEISLEGLHQELASFPVEQFAQKEKVYKAVICFAKFLINKKTLADAFLQETKGFKPKRHKPPKRHSVDPEGLQKLYASCETFYDRVLLTVLANTGLRASELCALTVNDLDLQKQVLIVSCGKGGKRRTVGLNRETVDILTLYMRQNPTLSKELFFNAIDEPLDRDGLLKRLKRIGKRADVEVSPHALRRAFVTINANKGRPLQMLQLACGHSDIKTTMSYCRTTEQQLLEAMKQWD